MRDTHTHKICLRERCRAAWLRQPPKGPFRRTLIRLRPCCSIRRNNVPQLVHFLSIFLIASQLDDRLGLWFHPPFLEFVFPPSPRTPPALSLLCTCFSPSMLSCMAIFSIVSKKLSKKRTSLPLCVFCSSLTDYDSVSFVLALPLSCATSDFQNDIIRVYKQRRSSSCACGNRVYLKSPPPPCHIASNVCSFFAPHQSPLIAVLSQRDCPADQGVPRSSSPHLLLLTPVDGFHDLGLGVVRRVLRSARTYLIVIPSSHGPRFLIVLPLASWRRPAVLPP